MARVVNCDLNELGGASNSGALRFELVRSGRAAGSFHESLANFVGGSQDTVARCSGKCERCCVWVVGQFPFTRLVRDVMNASVP
jgi:hypothetical protein